ncbi:MAG: ABC transporter substrate-binding protein [Gammaproteobacteria bacterium]|nr:ABC transporter substrate-binding protein [Gammaproteobacteria bacterium]
MLREVHVGRMTVLSVFFGALFFMSASALAGKDVGKGDDHRTFHSNGKIDYGKVGDSYNADLVMYLAGNQFMVMQDLISAFQKHNPDIKTVFVETIPPGQILKGQILKQGEIAGQKIAKNPDLFASVNVNHLKKLHTKEMMNDFMIYTHNKLALEVLEGNPKHIKGPKDLARDDVVVTLPNPLTEGIFKFYGSQMLKDLGIYEKVTDGKKCKSCWAIKDKTWFTSRHHRETPIRLLEGKTDVGVVWVTEIIYQREIGRKIEGVDIPAPYNMKHKVGYAIGALKSGRNPYNAMRYLAFLGTDEAQSIYAKHGFIKATQEELRLKPLPLLLAKK